MRDYDVWFEDSHGTNHKILSASSVREIISYMETVDDCVRVVSVIER